MLQKPLRPEPTEKITDYDDGDPYSCIAAGRQEERLQEALAREVEACFPAAAEDLERLVRRDAASVLTALCVGPRAKGTLHAAEGALGRRAAGGAGAARRPALRAGLRPLTPQ